MKIKKDIVYFDNPNDCFEKLKYYLEDKKYEYIVKNGQDKLMKLPMQKNY